MKSEIYTQTELLSSSFVLLPETHQKAKEKFKQIGHILLGWEKENLSLGSISLCL